MSDVRKFELGFSGTSLPMRFETHQAERKHRLAAAGFADQAKRLAFVEIVLPDEK